MNKILKYFLILIFSIFIGISALFIDNQTRSERGSFIVEFPLNVEVSEVCGPSSCFSREPGITTCTADYRCRPENLSIQKKAYVGFNIIFYLTIIFGLLVSFISLLKYIKKEKK